MVKEFERRLRVQDAVIKFITVRIDETLKRVEKRKKEREKRAHRRPQAAAPQPSLAQQMLGGASEGSAASRPPFPWFRSGGRSRGPAHPVPATIRLPRKPTE